MKKDIKQSIKIIILGVLLAGAAAFAQTWTAPGQVYPNANTSAPINITGTAQVKADAFGLDNGVTVTGTSSGSAWLVGDVVNTSNTASYPGKKIYVSGKMGIGISSPAEGLDIGGAGTIKTNSLAHAASPYNLKEVCVNSAGVLYLCTVLPTGPAPSCPGSPAVFTSPGTYTFKTNYCASSITVETWGAGAAGGGGAGASAGSPKGGGGGAGGGGAYTRKTITVSPFQSFTVVVGAGASGPSGGAAGSNAGGTNTSAGGVTTFSGTGISLVAGGGTYGGGAPYGNGYGGNAGTGGTASGGTFTITGANGGAGQASYDPGAGSGPCSGAGGSASNSTNGGGGGGGGAGYCDRSSGDPGGNGGFANGGGGGGGGRSGGVSGPHSGGAGGSGGNGRVEVSW